MSTSTIKHNSELEQAVRIAAEQSLQRIREHPFILAANAKRLTQTQAERWIKCAGRESRSFPNILENLIIRTANDGVREILQENLNDEYGNGNPDHAHFRHYLQLLDDLHISRDDFYNYEELAGIKLALSLAYNISRQDNQAAALGYMIVNEGMTPITYAAARNALGHYYPQMDATFFQLHVEVDEKHVNDLYVALGHFDLKQKDDVLFGISIGERGMAVLLDEAYGIFDYCREIPRYSPSPN